MIINTEGQTEMKVEIMMQMYQFVLQISHIFLVQKGFDNIDFQGMIELEE